MFTNVAYLHNSLADMVDTSRSLVVTSCGYYRVHSRPVVSTERLNGRKDYQLLYIAKGKDYFYFDGPLGQETVITEGNMILFAPVKYSIITIMLPIKPKYTEYILLDEWWRVFLTTTKCLMPKRFSIQEPPPIMRGFINR